MRVTNRIYNKIVKNAHVRNREQVETGQRT